MMTSDLSKEGEALFCKAEEAYSRLDACLPLCFPEDVASRSMAQKLIAQERVTVNGKLPKASSAVECGAEICVLLPPPEPVEAVPENIPLDIVYEDADLIVVNKPRGMVVHPAAGNPSGTLVNALLYHCRDLSSVGGVIRPGIVHRIDKDTTGLIAAAKNDRAHLALSAQLADHTMHRIYVAVAEGILKEDDGTIDAAIGRSPRDRKKMCVTEHGRSAVTHYTVLARSEQSRTSLVSCRLETGRTHQIRVHLASIGHPVSGDPVYGCKNTRGMAGQALHARELCFLHPADGKPMRFSAPPPEDFMQLLRACHLPEEIV